MLAPDSFKIHTIAISLEQDSDCPAYFCLVRDFDAQQTWASGQLTDCLPIDQQLSFGPISFSNGGACHQRPEAVPSGDDQPCK